MAPPKLDVQKLQEAYKHASSRQFYLDYDGTLAPIVKKPEDAKPSAELLKLLQTLSDDSRNSIYIISGRDRKFLKEELGSVPLGLSAEHGAFLRQSNSNSKPDEWRDVIKSKNINLDWKDQILSAFKGFCDKVPEAFVEAKEYAITLHYRQSDKSTVKPNKEELQKQLDELCSKHDTLDVRKGKKTLEARVKGITKGYIIKEILNTCEKDKKVDFVMCIGDDVTDEDMFVALAQEKQLKNVFACTVGLKQKTSATVYIEKQSDVLTALSSLSSVAAS